MCTVDAWKLKRSGCVHNQRVSMRVCPAPRGSTGKACAAWRCARVAAWHRRKRYFREADREVKRTEKPSSQLLALAEKLAAWAGLVYTLPFKRVRVETVAFGVQATKLKQWAASRKATASCTESCKASSTAGCVRWCISLFALQIFEMSVLLPSVHILPAEPLWFVLMSKLFHFFLARASFASEQ